MLASKNRKVSSFDLTFRAPKSVSIAYGIADLTGIPKPLRDEFSRRAKEIRAFRGKGLATKTVRYIHGTIGKSLHDAERLGLVTATWLILPLRLVFGDPQIM